MVTKIQIAGKLKFYSKPYGRQWKWRYQTHGHVNIPTLQVPKKLQNVNIIDPLAAEKTSRDDKPTWQPARRHPMLEGFFPQPTIEDHPNYHATPIKKFDRTCKFHAGIEQVGLLTKTKTVQGLASLPSFEPKANNDKIVSNYIKQALAFTPTKVVSPRLEIPSDVKFMIAREYATPQTEQMKVLLDNLIRLCNINISQQAKGPLTDRVLLQDSPVSAIINRGGDLVQIRRNSEFTLFTNKPLSPVAPQAQIDETVSHQLIDMYPIFPTIDLVDNHVYDLTENTYGWDQTQTSLKFANTHTFFHVDAEQLNDEANAAKLMMFAFGSAIAQSRSLQAKKQLELNDDMTLKKPIVINGVSISDSHRLNFVQYQLNTLNLKDNVGVKNLCFYDTGNQLYFNRPTVDKLPYPTHKNIQRLALRKLDYNPKSFSKLLDLLAF